MCALTRKMSSVKRWQAKKYNKIHYKEERNVYLYKTITHCNIAQKKMSYFILYYCKKIRGQHVLNKTVTKKRQLYILNVVFDKLLNLCWIYQCVSFSCNRFCCKGLWLNHHHSIFKINGTKKKKTCNFGHPRIKS